MVTFGDRLDQIRETCGFHTVESLADEAGINRTQMENLLNRIYPPSLPTLERLAMACGVPISAFLDGVRTRTQRRPQGGWDGQTTRAQRPPSKDGKRKSAS